MISQREAVRLRKELKELKELRERERNGYVKEWPDGEFLFTLAKSDTVDVQETEAIRCVRRMGHPVMVTEQNGSLNFYGIK